VLLELIGGGEDGEVRHLGEQLRAGGEVDRVSEAPRPSILASIGRKLSIVAVSRNFLAFEDEFSAGGAKIRCWVTMLPLSSAGAWVDYIYAFVSFGPATESRVAEEPAELEEEPVEIAEAAELEPEASEPAEPVETEPEVAEAVEAIEQQPEAPQVIEEEPEVTAELDDVAAPPAEEVLELDSPVEEPVEAAVQPEAVAPEPAPAATAKKEAGFSFDGAVSGFYAKAVKVQPTLPKAAPAKAAAPAEEEPILELEEEISPAAKVETAAPPAQEKSKPAAGEKPHKTTSATEGSLQSKLTEVRAKADEARMAKLRANMALYEGLSAAYDFALDAEDSPEEYLKIVEAQGLKIQLRSPMRPVVKLAFDGMCDDSMIAQLEAVLAWAIDQELPRGTLAKHIEEAGGIGPILNGMAKAA
jgi:hypothetical protein